MSIPKGLILYRAQRHQESLPLNIKQRYYSNKISLSPPTQIRNQYVNFHHQYQKKFAQEVSFKIYDSAPRENHALAILPKFSHIIKCKIEPAYQVFQERSVKSMAKVFKKAFKVLKRIKKLKIGLSGEPQNRARACKTLLLLTDLESLTLPNFVYSEDNKTIELLLEAIKSGSKRKSWPDFKSLNVQLEPPYLKVTNPQENGIFTRGLKILLEFLQGLKSCQKIYECSSFELKLSPWASINPEQANLLAEIASIAPSLTSLKGCEANRFSALSMLVQQQSEHLKRVELDLHGVSQPNLKLSALTDTLNFQELTLLGVFLEEKLFNQISFLENLTTLSVRFRQMPASPSKEAVVLAEVISNLANLRSLELDFSCQIYFGPGRSKLENCPWLYRALQAIGSKLELEKLSLIFSPFEFQKAELVFHNLCQNLENLANLSHFNLQIMHADTLGNEEVLRLGQCLSKLPKIQEFTVRLTKSSFSFSTKTFFALVDCIVKNLPLLSRLWLVIGKVEMNDESCQLLVKKINKMRCLNWVSLDFQGGKLKSDVALRSLAAEIRKRRTGGVNYIDIDEGSVFHF